MPVCPRSERRFRFRRPRHPDDVRLAEIGAAPSQNGLPRCRPRRPRLPRLARGGRTGLHSRRPTPGRRWGHSAAGACAAASVASAVARSSTRASAATPTFAHGATRVRDRGCQPNRGRTARNTAKPEAIKHGRGR